MMSYFIKMTEPEEAEGQVKSSYELLMTMFQKDFRI